MSVDISARINAIIDSQGVSVTYKRVTGVSFNSTTLANTPTYSNSTIFAHVRKYNANEVAGIIRQGDREVRIAASEITFTPEEQDIITIGSKDYKVMAVDTRTAYGSAVLHILMVRGGV